MILKGHRDPNRTKGFVNNNNNKLNKAQTSSSSCDGDRKCVRCKTEAKLLNFEATVSRTTAIIITAGRGGEKVRMEWNSVCTSHPGKITKSRSFICFQPLRADQLFSSTLLQLTDS